MRRFLLPLGLATLLSTACRNADEPAAGSAPAAPAAPPVADEPASCRPCHADVVDRFEGSAHRLALRRRDDAAHPPKARIVADAPIAESARATLSLRPKDGGADLLVPDTDGASEPREVSHVIGGMRREDFLSPLSGGPHPLPVSWSVTRSAWIDPMAEELGGPIATDAPAFWTAPRRAHAIACSRCHPMPRGDAPSGIQCASCHGDASAHVARKTGGADATTWARDALRRATDDAWKGCGGCHATGNERPRTTSVTEASPLPDRLLPATLVGPGGVDLSFRMDGAPRVAHGLEVQALAASRCFTEGGATCTTCHDPHGGPGAALKDADPDASCRACHAKIAADGAAHSKHRAPGRVPSAREEPAGPTGGRAPGCVDCHAPALVAFGAGDLARDHAISVPSPRLESALGLPDACSACHPAMSAAERASRAPGSEARPRDRRMAAFAAAADARDDASRRAAAAKLAGVVADDRQHAWLRASSAYMLADLGEAGSEGLPALTRALSHDDPVLAIAAAVAIPRVGGPSDALKERAAKETDWRVALALSSGLAALGDPKGAGAIEAMYADESLPAIARADAGVELAVLLIRARSCRRAESVLQDALTKDPLSVPAWLNIGVARACAGDVAGARDAFRRVLELQPGQRLAIANLEALANSGG